MIDERDWARLARYLAGESAPEDAAATARWIEEDPERQEAHRVMSEAWRRSGSRPSDWRTHAAWSRVAARMPRAAKKTRRRPRVWWLAIPAVAAAGLAGVALYSGKSPERSPERVAARADHEYETDAGQRAVVNLLDGTRVELGVASKLRVHMSESGPRDVYLDGEAVFDVAHDEQRSFVVHAKNGIAQDIGTRFNVRAYSSDAGVRVVVMHGAVAFGSARDSSASRQVLHPGTAAVLDSNGHLSVLKHADTTAASGWTRDRFIATDEPLASVARQIERWFDVRVEIRDAAAASSRVTINTPATRVSDVIGAAVTPLGLVYSQTERTIVVRRPVSAGAGSITPGRSRQ